MYNRKSMVIIPLILFLFCLLTAPAQGQDALGFSQLVKGGTDPKTGEMTRTIAMPIRWLGLRTSFMWERTAIC